MATTSDLVAGEGLPVSSIGLFVSGELLISQRCRGSTSSAGVPSLPTIEVQRFGRLQTDADAGIFLPNVRFQLAKPSLKEAGIEVRLGRMENQEDKVFEVGISFCSGLLISEIL